MRETAKPVFGPAPNGDAVRRFWPLAIAAALLLAAILIALIVNIDNTNVGTTNGLWKAPGISAWAHEGRGQIDNGESFYYPALGFLTRIVPDGILRYGTPAPDVTYRKLALWNAIFAGIASAPVFFLALHVSGSPWIAAAICLLHAGAGFVLLNRINSEDIMPAYTFFLGSAVCLFEFLFEGGLRLFAASALLFALATLFHWTAMAQDWPPSARCTPLSRCGKGGFWRWERCGCCCFYFCSSYWSCR